MVENILLMHPKDDIHKRTCLYAPDVVQGADGRYYLHYSVNGSSIMSVAVCDTPAGEYTYYGDVVDTSGKPVGYYYSDYPDRDFVFGGRVHSTSDVGINGHSVEFPAYPVGYIHNISDKCIIGYKYFEVNEVLKNITLTLRGHAKGKLIVALAENADDSEKVGDIF